MKETVAGRWSSTLGVKLDGHGWPAARESSFPDRAAAGAHVGGGGDGASGARDLKMVEWRPGIWPANAGCASSFEPCSRKKKMKKEKLSVREEGEKYQAADSG